MSRTIYQQSASGANRSLNCPGWSALLWYYRDDIADSPDSEWSLDGDAAHLLIENELNKKRKDKQPDRDKVVKANERLMLSDEKEHHLAAVRFAVSTIKKARKERGGEWETEQYIDILPQYAFGGHCDFMQVTDDTLYVDDYKHGVGVPVIAVNNMQLISYLLGCSLKLDLKHLKRIKYYTGRIIQPRCMAVEPVQTVTYNTDEFKKQVKQLTAGIGNAHGVLIQCQTLKTKPKKKHLLRGDHCQFCPAKPVCPRWHKPANKTIKQYQKDTGGNPDDYSDLPQKKLEQLWIDSQGIYNYLEKVKGQILANMAHGKGAGLVKQVPGNTRSYVTGAAIPSLRKLHKKGKITDEQLQACIKEQTVSISLLRQQLPAKVLASLVRETRNKPSLVPANDKRQSLKESIKAKFNG